MAGYSFLRVIAATESAPSFAVYDAETLAYVAIAAPLQELVFRGYLQNTARRILGGRRRAGSLAVAISTAAFALSHLPWGVETAVLMVVPGLVWGAQFERDRTLIGVMLSHAAIGYLFVGSSPLWSVITGRM